MEHNKNELTELIETLSSLDNAHTDDIGKLKMQITQLEESVLEAEKRQSENREEKAKIEAKTAEMKKNFDDSMAMIQKGQEGVKPVLNATLVEKWEEYCDGLKTAFNTNFEQASELINGLDLTYAEDSRELEVAKATSKELAKKRDEEEARYAAFKAKITESIAAYKEKRLVMPENVVESLDKNLAELESSKAILETPETESMAIMDIESLINGKNEDKKEIIPDVPFTPTATVINPIVNIESAITAVPEKEMEPAPEVKVEATSVEIEDNEIACPICAALQSSKNNICVNCEFNFANNISAVKSEQVTSGPILPENDKEVVIPSNVEEEVNKKAEILIKNGFEGVPNDSQEFYSLLATIPSEVLESSLNEVREAGRTLYGSSWIIGWKKILNSAKAKGILQQNIERLTKLNESTSEAQLSALFASSEAGKKYDEAVNNDAQIATLLLWNAEVFETNRNLDETLTVVMGTNAIAEKENALGVAA